jgi:hypothetical protein
MLFSSLAIIRMLINPSPDDENKGSGIVSPSWQHRSYS